MADITILQNIQRIFNRMSLPTGRVSRLSYTQQAYDDALVDPDKIAGVDAYSYGQEQNIPLATRTETASSILDKGFRAQGASIPRGFQNHFMGRLSFNVNMIVDTFLKIFDWLYRFAAESGNAYNAGITYQPGDIAIYIQEVGGRKVATWYQRIGTQPTTNVPPTDPTRWERLRERTSLSASVPALSSLNAFLDTGVYDCTTSYSTVTGFPKNDLDVSIVGPFMLRVHGDITNANAIVQEITYTESGLEYTRTLRVIGGVVTVVKDWYQTKNPDGLNVIAVPYDLWVFSIRPSDGHLIMYYNQVTPPDIVIANAASGYDPTDPLYGHLIWEVEVL